MQELLTRELAATAPILSGVYGNFGLLVRPHASAPATLPPHLLGKIVDLALGEDDVLRGAAVCDPLRLPFAGESFKLAIVQHALERIDNAAGFAAELARVLAPEGIALVFGFNPLGTWRPWLMRQQRRGARRLGLQSAQSARVLLAREQVDTLQVRFPGLLWPRAAGAAGYGGLLARFGSSWLLIARKRRSTLTPLRLRAPAREVALNPRLLPGAHRECA
jgi:SAM-dependent methyltransferase